MESSPVVTVLGKSNVRPATPMKRGHFFLACLDIMWQHIHYNRRVIFYKTSPQDQSSAVENLRTSLSHVLVHFYPFAGRLALGEDQRLVIDCNDLGAEFVEASIDLPMSELEKDDFGVKDFFEDLCQRLEHMNEHLYTSPLLSVQVTRFSDGGLAVAVAISHVVADGQSLWNFLVSWGECARGKALSAEPLHERSRLAVQNPSPEKAFLEFEAEEDDDGELSFVVAGEEKKAKPEKAAEVEKLTTENGNGPATVTEKPMEHDGTDENRVDEEASTKSSEGNETVQALFHLSGENIKKLKSEAAATTGKSFSSYVVLCAHFWQRITIARKRPSSERAGFAVLANFRTRLTPPLPPQYFGNVINFTIAGAKAGTIVQESLGAVATRIQDAIMAATVERLYGMMNWLELHENTLLTSVRFEGSMVNVASSPRFPVYEVDFGWGQPAAVRAVKGHDGELVLFAGRAGSNPGDVEICAALSSDAKQNLLLDEHFLATTPFTPL